MQQYLRSEASATQACAWSAAPAFTVWLSCITRAACQGGLSALPAPAGMLLVQRMRCMLHAANGAHVQDNAVPANCAQRREQVVVLLVHLLVRAPVGAQRLHPRAPQNWHSHAPPCHPAQYPGEIQHIRGAWMMVMGSRALLTSICARLVGGDHDVVVGGELGRAAQPPRPMVLVDAERAAQLGLRLVRPLAHERDSAHDQRCPERRHQTSACDRPCKLIFQLPVIEDHQSGHQSDTWLVPAPQGHLQVAVMVEHRSHACSMVKAHLLSM